MNPTPAELAAMVEAMTPGKWRANYRRITPVDGPQDGSNDVCHVYGGEEREVANARGIVALRNSFPAWWGRYQEMVRALEAANVLLSLSEHNGCSGHRQIVAALANANKPLEAS